MKITRTVAPGQVLNLEAVRMWLSIGEGQTGSDPFLEQIAIPDAEAYYESETGRRLDTQTWTISLDADEITSEIDLLTLTTPLAPLASVTSIVTYDTNDSPSTVTSSDYNVRTGEHGLIRLESDASWPSDVRTYDAMLITCQIGYGADSVPQTSLLTLRSLLAFLFRNRGTGAMESAAGGLHTVDIPRHIRDRLTLERVDWTNVR